MSCEDQELRGLFYMDASEPAQDIHIRVVPGQSEEAYREVARLVFKLPGGIAAVTSETMSTEEAQRFRGLATYEIRDHRD